MYNLDKLVVYVSERKSDQINVQEMRECGSISRLNDALFKPRLHVQCKDNFVGRYIYVEAWGVPNRWTRLFSAVLCEVMVYE